MWTMRMGSQMHICERVCTLTLGIRGGRERCFALSRGHLWVIMSLTAVAADGQTGYRSSADAPAMRTVFLVEAKMFASAHLSYAVAA